MVFQSFPFYLDPPNWHHQQQNQLPVIPTHDSLHVIPPPPTTTGGPGGSSARGGMGSIRPGSTADRARQAKLPLPEAGLKCPRCESANTKFCYFNNYSLSQPRHFCKTCRRYWTRGGSLRNVPVGGGCRRNIINKRSKGSRRSKSPVTTTDHLGSLITGNSTNHSSCSTSSGIGGGGRRGGGGGSNRNAHLTSSLPPQLPFLLGGYAPGDIGLHIGGIQPPPMAAAGGGGSADMEFQMGCSSSVGIISPAGVSYQHPFRLPPPTVIQQFPFLTGLEPSPPPPPPPSQLLQPPVNELYSFQGSNQIVNAMDSGGKIEQNENQGLGLSKNLLAIHIGGDDRYNWSSSGGNAWPDLL